MAEKTKFEFSRKAVHMLSLLVPLCAYFHVGWTQVTILCFITFYAVSETWKVKGKHFWFHRYILKMQRDGERNTWARAPFFLAVGVLGSITLFSWEAALIGIYQAGMCDTMAALFGKKFGGTPFPFFSTRKTFTGTLAFIAFALPVCFIFLSPSKAIVLALIGGFLESLPVKDWDNLTVPLIISFLAELFLF